MRFNHNTQVQVQEHVLQEFTFNLAIQSNWAGAVGSEPLLPKLACRPLGSHGEQSSLERLAREMPDIPLRVDHCPSHHHDLGLGPRDRTLSL